jgi:hypothetical protein
MSEGWVRVFREEGNWIVASESLADALLALTRLKVSDGSEVFWEDPVSRNFLRGSFAALKASSANPTGVPVEREWIVTATTNFKNRARGMGGIHEERIRARTADEAMARYLRTAFYREGVDVRPATYEYENPRQRPKRASVIDREDEAWWIHPGERIVRTTRGEEHVDHLSSLPAVEDGPYDNTLEGMRRAMREGWVRIRHYDSLATRVSVGTPGWWQVMSQSRIEAWEALSWIGVRPSERVVWSDPYLKNEFDGTMARFAPAQRENPGAYWHVRVRDPMGFVRFRTIEPRHESGVKLVIGFRPKGGSSLQKVLVAKSVHPDPKDALRQAKSVIDDQSGHVNPRELRTSLLYGWIPPKGKAHWRWNPRGPVEQNPPGSRVLGNPDDEEVPLIYGATTRIEMKRTHGKYRGEKFYHHFGSGVAQHGLPEGTEIRLPSGRRFQLPRRSVLLTGPKGLWGHYA